MEKRASTRHDMESAVVCSYLTSRDSSGSYAGEMKNYSDAGLYAEFQVQLKKGTILLVRTTGIPSNRLGTICEEGFRSISLAQVKWSKPVFTKGAVRYGTGLKHLVS